jgi:hypothetical protein
VWWIEFADLLTTRANHPVKETALSRHPAKGLAMSVNYGDLSQPGIEFGGECLSPCPPALLNLVSRRTGLKPARHEYRLGRCVERWLLDGQEEEYRQFKAFF